MVGACLGGIVLLLLGLFIVRRWRCSVGLGGKQPTIATAEHGAAPPLPSGGPLESGEVLPASPILPSHSMPHHHRRRRGSRFRGDSCFGGGSAEKRATSSMEEVLRGAGGDPRHLFVAPRSLTSICCFGPGRESWSEGRSIEAGREVAPAAAAPAAATVEVGERRCGGSGARDPSDSSPVVGDDHLLTQVTPVGKMK